MTARHLPIIQHKNSQFVDGLNIVTMIASGVHYFFRTGFHSKVWTDGCDNKVHIAVKVIVITVKLSVAVHSACHLQKNVNIGRALDFPYMVHEQKCLEVVCNIIPRSLQGDCLNNSKNRCKRPA